MKNIAALVVWSGESNLKESLQLLQQNPDVQDLAVLCLVEGHPEISVDGDGEISWLRGEKLWSRQSLDRVMQWFHDGGARNLLLLQTACPLIFSGGLQRMQQAMTETGALWLYSDFQDFDDDKPRLHPLIDYQNGSLRDDFDFGSVLLLARDAALQAWTDQRQENRDLHFGALYDLRLRISEQGRLFHLPEPCYLQPAQDKRNSGQKVFDYVDPRQRDYQIEMEQIATAHLKRVDAWLPAATGQAHKSEQKFALRASVVIPVRNRVKTIAEAVQSALEQKTDFDFNVIVVDNHSSDGTTELLKKMSASHKRLVHIIPQRRDLGIGGCWNEAIYSPRCGEYAVQLDSDDLYAVDDVLARIVDGMRAENAALAVGAYTTVNFDLEEQAPGLIDHREWSDENGHNNLLRIHGMGAPRAYHVPSLRPFGFPNVSYGEDYAVVLRLSRQYRVLRIFENLYWCRRWEGNSDSNLDIATQNRYHYYKDSLRTVELCARRRQPVLRRVSGARSDEAFAPENKA